MSSIYTCSYIRWLFLWTSAIYEASPRVYAGRSTARSSFCVFDAWTHSPPHWLWSRGLLGCVMDANVSKGHAAFIIFAVKMELVWFSETLVSCHIASRLHNRRLESSSPWELKSSLRL